MSKNLTVLFNSSCLAVGMNNYPNRFRDSSYGKKDAFKLYMRKIIGELKGLFRTIPLEKEDENKVEITCRVSSGVNRVRVIRMLPGPGLLPGDVRLV